MRKRKSLLAVLLSLIICLPTQDFLVLAENLQTEGTVSGNSLSVENVSENTPPKETVETEYGQPGKTVSGNTPSVDAVSGNGGMEETVPEGSVSENSISQNSISENSLFRARRVSREGTLSDDVLKRHTVKGLNPEQAVVTLFDYWKDDDSDKGRDDRRFSPNEYLGGGSKLRAWHIKKPYVDFREI